MVIVRIVGGLGNQMFQYAYAKALQKKGYNVKIDISKFKKYKVTKLGEGLAGLFAPSFNAYVQILPRMSEAVGYDASQIPAFWRLVVLLGTWAEFILPALLLLGLLTRLAALGMIGFVLVQSYVDIVGHHADPTTLGAWFDAGSGSLILDQRAFWVFLLLYLVLRGAGPLSLDAILSRRQRPQLSAT